MKRLGHLLGMLAAWLVIVGDDDAGSVSKCLGEVVLPPACAHGVARSEPVVGTEGLDVLLALDDDNRDMPFGVDERGQVVQNRLDALEVPDVPTSAIWPTLAKGLRAAVSNYLENEAGDLVKVRVDLLDLTKLVGRLAVRVKTGFPRVNLPTVARAFQPVTVRLGLGMEAATPRVVFSRAMRPVVA